ncbi:MAG TPA: hypothetical protein VMZ50_04840 [Phycisphaerae bacterium]|nr:hypothetical protein [Phycisphaerae bacterium]
MSGFSEKDKGIIRDLARRVAEIAAQPRQAEKAELWRQLNDLYPVRPMVLIFPEGSWREVPLELRATEERLRRIEWGLRAQLYSHEVLRDDNVCEGVFYSPIVVRDTGFGIEARQTRPDEPTGAGHFEPVIVTEQDFFDKVRRPQIAVDGDATERAYRQNCELFDGTLRVEKCLSGANSYAMIDRFAQWRGLDRLFLDMIDRPEWLHRCLRFLTDCRIEMVEKLQRDGALTLNNRGHYTGSGGVGFTGQLPQKDFDGKNVRTMDLWGFATTQIFSEVSPAMHAEFALRYEIEFLSRFGLNAYGCCEPLHLKMDQVRKIPRLRRVSMSPWVDMDRAARELGGDYVFSRKPNPAVMASITWDAGAVRRSIRDDLERTRGCVVELVMKDTHTCNHDPRRLADWVRIARQEAEAFAS